VTDQPEPPVYQPPVVPPPAYQPPPAAYPQPPPGYAQPPVYQPPPGGYPYPQQPQYGPPGAGYPAYPPYAAYPGYPPAWAPYAPAPNRYGWLKWVGIGCGGLVALGIVGVVIGAVWIFTHAPLKDFPAYPNANQTSDNISSVNGTTHETRIWRVPADITTTEAWYATHVNGKWVLDEHLPAATIWTFHVTDGGSGDVEFSTNGASSTTVQVDFNG
jgi:hypothetical protein